MIYRVLHSLLIILLCPVPVFADDNRTINVFVSILPQQFLVERIGGQRVNVSTMVRAGARPETYEPTPKQMSMLARTSLYFRVGVPFEDVWMDKIASQNPDLKIIDCCAAIKKEVTDQNDDERADDRHIWTSPLIAIRLAEGIRDALIEQDAAHKTLYKRNYQSLEQELLELDEYIRQRLQPLSQRFLFVSHPSWGYFCKAYDLRQIAIEQHGSEVRAHGLVELIELAQKENIHAVYTQKQFNTASAEILAREISADVIELDPLAPDYIENLRHVADMIVKGSQ